MFAEIISASRRMPARNHHMPKTKVKAYSQSLLDLMGETSGAIMKARALAAMGMPELAQSAWLWAAAREEQVAPLLEVLSRDQEAAVHRISAASSYQSAGELGKAINLYRAALTGPLPEHTREQTQQRIVNCLAQLARSANGNAAMRHAKGCAST
jgi:hypothetical protein